MDANGEARSKLDLSVLFEYVEKRDASEGGYKQSIISSYEHYARWSNPIVRVILYVIGFPIKPKVRSVKYFFWGTKYKELILSLPKNDVCVIGGPEQMLFCIRHRRYFLSGIGLLEQMWRHFISGLRCKDSFTEDRLNKGIKRMSSQLRKYVDKDSVLVVNNDSLPMQRFMILAARAASISQTVCIQHGIFQSKSNGQIMDGWFADHFFSINEEQKSLLIEKGMERSKIKVMGFHSSPYIPTRKTAVLGKRRVCFIGQPWIKYGEERGRRYLDIVQKVKKIFEPSSIAQMFYKPHPWESNMDYLTGFDNVINVSMYRALEEFDVFISLTSTALLEANVAGRIAIQIVDPLFDADDFSMYGEIISIKNSDDNFRNILLSAVDSTPPEYQSTNSLKHRFVSALGD